MNIGIVYEDKNLLVINKPSGLITHPKDATDKQKSVTSWLVEKYPEIKTVGEDPLRPGLVHRLDKDTSGLLVIAKNQESFTYLKSLFQEKKIKKFYLALVHGKPKEPKGIIDAPLGRIGMKRTTQLHGKKKLKDKKEAITEYGTIKNFQNFTLLEVSPHTGRTHQIRVHLKSLGTPVAGDPLYGHKDPKEPSRLFLHAYKLQFVSPDGKALTIETELPEELQNFINALE
ncbi:MAG: RluA family pseudouridine synthase [Candidatus Yanofskybacteria bacterium]|nr:RluA family pseudouridine synthase [Candidatus Yanofskybacteria bacterium]